MLFPGIYKVKCFCAIISPMEKLSANQQAQNAREFAQYWQDKGDEKSQTHNF